MGGAVSAGSDNDELVDNLLEADYIKTAAVERVFRAVDRGNYFTVEYKERAYRDIAWKCGNLHISAPCIYSKVMENLKLAPGLSFLNLGSGTGYLSTMAGLILGPYGINHGIEIHEDVLNYATKKLEEFISSASAIDEYEFCEPKFVYGNCLHLGSGVRQYDRVYCSAACPENHENYMKNLIKVGGILVIPVNDQLLQICRTSDTNWESKSVLPVSFATLICGKSPDVNDLLKMPDADPLPLQEICRFVVRSILRRNIDIEHPELKKPPRVPRKRVKKRTRQVIMPIFHGNSDDDEEDFVSLQTGRSIINLRHILRPTTPHATIFATHPGGMAESNESPGNEVDEDDAMEEDSNFNVESQNIFNEMSESDFQELENMLAMSETSGSESDFQELENMLAMSETSGSESDFQELENMLAMSETSGSEPEGGKQKLEGESRGGAKRQKSRNKQEKVDSGIVEDFENDEELVSETEKNQTGGEQYPFLKVTDSDTDTDTREDTLRETVDGKKSVSAPASDSKPPNESCTPSPMQSSPGSEIPPSDVVTYTTYMKEKIKLLPLPVTLKYFLNMNREL